MTKEVLNPETLAPCIGPLLSSLVAFCG